MAGMITRSGKVLEYHGKKFCATCKGTTDHTCFWLKYRKSETNDDDHPTANSDQYEHVAFNHRDVDSA